MKKITRIVVQVVISEYNENNELLGEEVSSQVAIYKAKTPDVWKFVEELVKEK